MSTEHNCPTCKHDIPADCSAPKYLGMRYEDKQVFWSSTESCELFEPKHDAPNTVGHCPG